MIVDIFIARKQRKNFSFTLSILNVIAATNSTNIEQQSCIFCEKTHQCLATE